MTGLKPILLAMCSLLLSAQLTVAGGLLDGRVFNGKIGPLENLDLDDSLHFANGHFWSDICTRCGFMPGVYSAFETDKGIEFTGVLESDSRGQFTYVGLIRADGSIDVTIRWERKRWYWTTRREIAFRGQAADTEAASLDGILHKMSLDDFDNPLCARF